MDYRNCPRFIEAEKYLNEKRIPELLHNLTSMVVYAQPGKRSHVLLLTPMCGKCILFMDETQAKCPIFYRKSV